MVNYKDAVEEKVYPPCRLLRNPLALFKIAKELRLYEKYGLDVKGSVFLTALLAGNAHLTTDSSAGVAGAVARGAPIVTVSTTGALPYQLVALPTLKSPAELKGKPSAAAASAPARIFSCDASSPTWDSPRAKTCP